MKEERLYHYTDFAAFDGIVRGRELRVNNVLNMNDSEEMQLFMNGIFAEVIRRLDAAGRADKIVQLQKYYKEKRKQIFKYSAYAACFSRFRDDAAQWERYAYRGKGVCIGMRAALLSKMTDEAVTLREVYYQDEVASHELIEKAYRLVLDTQDLEKSRQMEAFLQDAWRSSAAFKHPSFRSEKEVRLVVLPFEKDFGISPRYHVARERIKKYYPLNLEEMCRKAGSTMEELICEVIIGPESTQSLPILQDYLRDNSLGGLAQKVSLSSCPLRSKI